jgi:Zn-dependent protease
MTMKKPAVLTPSDPVWEITQIFKTPLVVRKDFSALPLAPLLATVYFDRHLRIHHPDLTRHRLAWSTVCALAMLGSEWCHNLTHTFVADRIGKPIDRIRVIFGMPLLVYYDPDDPAVTPREHMLRAIGGPLFNALTLLPLFLLQRAASEHTPQHFLARLTFGTNLFLLTAGLTPHPSLDGGPLLKWSLIDRGRSRREAEAIVKRANGIVAAVFSLLSVILNLGGKRRMAAVLGLMGLSSWAIALGWLDEAY